MPWLSACFPRDVWISCESCVMSVPVPCRGLDSAGYCKGHTQGLLSLDWCWSPLATVTVLRASLQAEHPYICISWCETESQPLLNNKKASKFIEGGNRTNSNTFQDKDGCFQELVLPIGGRNCNPMQVRRSGWTTRGWEARPELWLPCKHLQTAHDRGANAGTSVGTGWLLCAFCP